MGIWDEEENQEEFRDVPEETAKDYVPQIEVSQSQHRPTPTPAPQPNQANFNGATGRFEEAPVNGPTDEEFLDSILNPEVDEEDFEAVLNDANLRIEQGKLYQMIMNHDLFEGMEADANAVQNVQREIRKFARERMEIMLGMRQEKTATQVVSSPFNDLEVDILKKLASKATNGATETAEANQVAAAVRETPRRTTLKPLGGATGLRHTTKAPVVAAPAPRSQQKLPTKPSAPLKRTKNDLMIDQICAEQGITRADLELEYVGIGKNLHELTGEELAARQKQSAERLAKRKTVRSSSAIPMASPEQQEMLAVQRANQMNTVQRMDGMKIPGGMAALMEKVKNMPAKNP